MLYVYNWFLLLHIRLSYYIVIILLRLPILLICISVCMYNLATGFHLADIIAIGLNYL